MTEKSSQPPVSVRVRMERLELIMGQRRQNHRGQVGRMGRSTRGGPPPRHAVDRRGAGGTNRTSSKPRPRPPIITMRSREPAGVAELFRACLGREGALKLSQHRRGSSPCLPARRTLAPPSPRSSKPRGTSGDECALVGPDQRQGHRRTGRRCLRARWCSGPRDAASGAAAAAGVGDQAGGTVESRERGGRRVDSASTSSWRASDRRRQGRVGGVASRGDDLVRDRIRPGDRNHRADGAAFAAGRGP